MAPKRELFVEASVGGGAPPPEKRLREEAAAPGNSSSLPEPPPSPKHFLTIVLVVLFLKRPKGRNTDGAIPISASQFGRLMRDQIRRFINPLFRKLETVDNKLETMGSKLERIEEHVQDLTVKVDNITRPTPNHHDDEHFTQEANQEATTAEARRLATTEGKNEIQLRFLNGMKTHVYHDDEIKSESNTAIKIGIFDGDKMIESGGLSNLQIEIFSLEGDFPHASPKSWTAKKFKKHRAHARDGKGNVLAGEGTKAQLKNGQCDLGRIKFTVGSCSARNRKFIIGARVCEGEVSGVRIQEAVMNPVVVQDRRNKGNEKSYPPKLDDKVHRLEEIAKDGKYCKRLAGKKNIFTVEEFLKALNQDPDNLAEILEIRNKPKAWEKMTKHARECSLEGRYRLKSFVCAEKNVKLFFNCVHSLVGAKFFGGSYILSDKFSPEEQIIVAELKKDAYANLDRLPEDHVMTDNSSNPIHIDTYSGVSAGPSYISSEQPNCSVHLAAVQVGSIQGTEGLSHARVESSCQNANNDPVTASSIPDHNSLRNYQVAGIPVRPHSQILCANQSNNNPGTSSSIADHLNTYNYQDQGSLLAAQVQFSPLSNAMSQDPLESVGSMSQFLSDEDAQLVFQLEAAINNCGAPILCSYLGQTPARDALLDLGESEWQQAETALQLAPLFGIQAELLREFSSDEIRAMTQDFATIVGQGGFAQVFRGSLDDGTAVAVKRIVTSCEVPVTGDDDFLREVSIVANVHHRSLVRLLGYCLPRSGGGRYLVYPFFENGSLDRWLFHGGEESRRLLTWPARRCIAVDVAKALAYLHHECHRRILHLDVKPGNILLDGGLRVHVSDFGISVSVARDLMTSVVDTRGRGTFGYMAPEMLVNAVSDKSDVYSYGMTLLELVGGRRNFEEAASPASAPDLARDFFPCVVREKMARGELMEAVDATMADVDEEAVELVVKVALCCIQRRRDLRPGMLAVVDMLEGRVDADLPPESRLASAVVDFSEPLSTSLTHGR